MKPRRQGVYNRKRVLRGFAEGQVFAESAVNVYYGGNPEHKSNPGDFGLVPPAAPRPDKTLCDKAGIFSHAVATALLRRGVERGLISVQIKNDYPQNIWSVSDEGVPLEAQLENSEQGIYHGYPMPEGDPMREAILEAWCQRGSDD